MATEYIIGDAVLSVKIASQAGAYNGALLAEITNAAGSVSVVTLTNNYDANVGRTFDLNLDEGDSVRLGITARDYTIWSDSAGSVRTANVTTDSARINFEDDGGTDFDDVVLEASIIGGGSVTLPQGDSIVGNPYPLGVWEDFEALADQIHGEWEYIAPPEGWYTDNQSGKIEAGIAKHYGVKGENADDIIVELETNSHDKGDHNLYTLIDSQQGAEVVIDFDYSARKSHTGTDADFQVIVDGVVVETIVPDQVGFEHKTITIMGTGDVMRVEFKAIGGGSYGAILNHINVKQVFLNQAPEAADDYATGVEDTALTIAVADLLANDVDPDGDAIYEFSVQDAENGAVSYVGNDVIFLPQAGYTGPASFTYTITDGKGGFDTATVNLTIEATINEAPVVTGEDITGTEDIAVITPVADLLANDVDPEGEPLTIVSVQDAANGSVELVNGEVIFTPAANYSGPASYTYTVSDGEKESTATVNLTIAAVSDGPVAVDDAVTGEAGVEIVITPAELLGNDYDPEGDNFFGVDLGNPENGVVWFDGENVRFLADAAYQGPASFTYTISDDAGNLSTATVNVTITPSSNQAPVATDDALNGTQDTTIYIAPETLLANDYDPEGGNINGVALGNAVNGAVYWDGTQVVFEPADGYTGPASFTYTIADEQGLQSTATVNLTIEDSTIYGTPNDDNPLNGTEGNDTILGLAGDDTINGLGGDDFISGGQNDDTLTGGAGADTFVWTYNDIQPNGNGREIDNITDFNSAEDRLDLADLLQNEQNSDNLDHYLDFNYDETTGDTTIAVSALGSFDESDDSMECQQLADQLIIIEGVDLTAGNTIADENIIQSMLNNNQLTVDM